MRESLSLDEKSTFLRPPVTRPVCITSLIPAPVWHFPAIRSQTKSCRRSHPSAAMPVRAADAISNPDNTLFESLGVQPETEPLLDRFCRVGASATRASSCHASPARNPLATVLRRLHSV